MVNGTIYRDTTAIEAVNEGRDTPDAFYHKSTLIATSKWHSTDGWRGYNVITPEPGFKLLDSDWMTGDWDDAPDGHSENDTELRLHRLQREHGDLFIIYTPTSNVFSTGIDVLVRDPAARIERGKAVAHKTRRFDSPDGSFRVRYHATDVVSYNAATGAYKLDSGGWNTMTTAKRMNEYLPYGYRVARRNWVLTLFGARLDPAGVPLVDGMEITPGATTVIKTGAK